MLGAGFSRAVDNRMPLMGDLARKLLIDPEFRAMAMASETIGRIRTYLDGDRANVEVYLSQLVESATFLPAQDRTRRQDTLKIAYTKIIEFICDASTHAKVSTELIEFVELLHHEQIPVITTNYDTLIESAIASAGLVDATGLVVRPIDIYPVQMEYAANFYLQRDLAQRKGVQTFSYMKVHGSIDWYTPRTDSDRLFWHATRPTVDSDIESILEDSESAVSEMKRLVALPSPEKNAVVGHPALAPIWRHAFRTLHGTSVLVMIGCAFHEVDTTLVALVNEGLPLDQTIILINPDQDLKPHIERLIPRAVVWPWNFNKLQEFTNKIEEVIRMTNTSLTKT